MKTTNENHIKINTIRTTQAYKKNENLSQYSRRIGMKTLEKKEQRNRLREKNQKRLKAEKKLIIVPFIITILTLIWIVYIIKVGIKWDALNIVINLIGLLINYVLIKFLRSIRAIQNKTIRRYVKQNK